MTVLLLCAFAYRITGDAAHEWIGVSVFVLFIAHNIINRKWYKNIFKGTYTIRRIVMTSVNLSLALTMATLILTGLLISRTVLAFLQLSGGMALRQIHTTAAYWGLLLIAVHIGLHWGMFINAARNMTGITTKNRVRTIIVRLLAFLIVITGIWWSFDREMFSKLFQGFSFDYWDEERPALLFFAANLSIMAIYIFLTYYILKLVERKKGKH
jgi:small-conductance mechanosensitive channel